MSEARSRILLLAVVAATRIPFLTAGYGSDSDAWRLAAAARTIAREGSYVVSRPPGFPVHELVSALLWGWGPIALTGATALMGAVGCVTFASLLRHTGCSDHLLGGLALAFVPVVYMYSTSSLDQVWAMALLIGSFHALCRGRYVVSGLLLGIAGGCRITSLLCFLPFACVPWAGNTRRESARAVTALGLTTIVTAFTCFLPVLWQYGPGFFRFYDPAYPRWALVFYRATVGSWGLIGALALAGAIARLMWLASARRTWESPCSARERGVLLAAFGTVATVLAIFLRLPLESSYLIPAIPFVILILSKLLPRLEFGVLCLALCVSPLFLATRGISGVPGPTGASEEAHLVTPVGPLAVYPFVGPVTLDLEARERQMEEIRELIQALRAVPPGSAVITGHWSIEMTALGVDLLLPRLQIVEWLDETAYLRIKAAGNAIYCLPGQQRYNEANAGFDLANAEVIPLNIERANP